MTYNSRFGQSIFDIVTVLNVGIDNIIAFAKENELSDFSIIPPNTKLSIPATLQNIVVQKKAIPYNPVGVFKSRANQSIFDIATMLTGTLDNVVVFALNNGINTLIGAVRPATNFTYTNGIAIAQWCFKNKYIFANSAIVSTITRVIGTEDGRYIVTQSGLAILVR